MMADWTWLQDGLQDKLQGGLTGAMLAAVMATAAIGIAAAEQAARKAPAAMGWQEEGHKRVHPGAWWQTALGALLAMAAVWAWRSNTQGALAVGAAAILTWHACSTDMKDRWLAEHATVPLLVLGLLISPVALQSSRVDAMALNGVLLVAWQAIMPLMKGHPIEWDDFSGGDLVLGAAAGAWLGMGAGQTALLVAALTASLAMIAMPKAGAGQGGLVARLAGFDAETRTFPGGIYLAIGMWVMIASRIPG